MQMTQETGDDKVYLGNEYKPFFHVMISSH